MSALDDGAGYAAKNTQAAKPRPQSALVQQKPLLKSYTAMDAMAEYAFAPGAGAYSIDKSYSATHKKAPSFTIAQKYKNSQRDMTPGPGAYEYKRSYQHGASMSQSGRPASAFSTTSANVGPGSYNTDRSAFKRDGTSFGFKPQNKMAASTPGPGQYDVGHRMEEAGRFTMGQGRDGHFQNMYNINRGGPGVGAYNVGGRLSEQGFRIAGKYRSPCTNSNPGPGQYNIERKNQTKGYTFGARTKSFFFAK